MMSSFGVLICLNAENGQEIWKIDLFEKYGGRNIQWGVTENLAFENEKLFVTVGGEEANVIALNKDDGSLIWKSKGLGEKSAYCSPQIIEHADNKVLITQTEKHVLGIEISTGNVLWSHEFINQYGVHPNTPIYKDGLLFVFSGFRKGSIMLQIAEDGNSVTEIWKLKEMDCKVGGAVELNDRIYSSSGSKNIWFCLDWKTGEILYTTKEFKKGNVIWADGLLYWYTEQDGEIVLVEPTDNEFKIISSFEVPRGKKQHWAHISIHNKKLYVRHGTSLMVYKLEKK